MRGRGRLRTLSAGSPSDQASPRPPTGRLTARDGARGPKLHGPAPAELHAVLTPAPPGPERAVGSSLRSQTL